MQTSLSNPVCVSLHSGPFNSARISIETNTQIVNVVNQHIFKVKNENDTVPVKGMDAPSTVIIKFY